MKCKDCGELLVGDGVEEPIRCPKISEEEWKSAPPDNNILNCGEFNVES